MTNAKVWKVKTIIDPFVEYEVSVRIDKDDLENFINFLKLFKVEKNEITENVNK